MATSSKFTIRHQDPTGGSKNSETFNCDPAKINVNISSDTAVALDTFARAFTALSKDTYNGEATITQTLDIYEIINE